MSFKHRKTHQNCYGNTGPSWAPAFTYNVSRWYFVSTRGSTPSSWFFSAIAFWALSLTCMNLRKITSSLVWQVSSCKINYPLTSETRRCKGQRAWVCETCHRANLKVVLLSQFVFFKVLLLFRVIYKTEWTFYNMLAFQAFHLTLIYREMLV